ncbi:hypothetical protein JTE90_010928, partial [Oedothorax gibbosus]
MDIVFNFFLFCRAANIWREGDGQNNWRRLKKLNIMLYALGQRMQGQQKITDLITRTGGGIEGLIRIFNNTRSIHKPPFCLSAHRIYDMVAVFGGIKFNDVPRSFIKCGVSLRYIIHMRLKSATAMELVTTYWTLINAINETLPIAEQNDINEAEHLFHQLLLQKNSAFSNTTNKTGNVFGHLIVPNVIDEVMAAKPETRSASKSDTLLQKIKNSADYKKFNKSDNPRSCEVLEVWVGTLESDPDLVDTKDKVVDLLNWMSTIRDQRLGYGLQNLMTGLYLDPILDNLVNLKKKVAFLIGENDKLNSMNTQLRAENDLNTSSEERQELRLLSAENAKLMDQNQELLFRVQTFESKENAMTEIKKDFETHLGKVTGPLVKAVNEKVAELKGLTESTFAKITEQETKVLAQYKTFIGEVNSNRAVEKDLVKKIQDREKVLMDKFDKLVTSGIPEPPWVSSLMKHFTSAGDGSPSLVMEPPAEPAWASALMSKVSALEEGHLAPSLPNDSPVGVAPKPTSSLSSGGDPYSGLEFIALMDKGD